MLEFFTDNGRQTIKHAQRESRDLKHGYIGTGHLLLGLLETRRGTATAVLRNLDMDPDEIRDELTGVLPTGTATVTRADLPYTPQAKQVLQLALMYASELGHSWIGTEHLIMGLVREPEGRAGRILRYAGLTLDAVREEVLELLGAEVKEEQTPADSILLELHREHHRVAPILALASYHAARAKEAIKACDFERASCLRDEGTKLRMRALDLCRELEARVGSFARSGGPVASGLVEFEPPEEPPLRAAEMKRIHDHLVARERVLMVAPPGSGRMHLARSLAHHLRRFGTGDGKPARLLRLDPTSLSGQSFADLAEMARRYFTEGPRDSVTTFVLVPDLESFCGPRQHSKELAEAWRLITKRCVPGAAISLTWTTPSGLEQVREHFPEFTRSCTIVRLRGLSMGELTPHLNLFLKRFAAVHGVEFEDGFVDEILFHRRMWKSHADCGDPGRCLSLIRAVVRRENEQARSGHGAAEERLIDLARRSILTAVKTDRVEDAGRRFGELRRLQTFGMPLPGPTPGREILRSSVQRFVDWDNGPVLPEDWPGGLRA